jgi:RNA polymerase subunit RPABC4/transcription elongation factor Spt4
MKKRKTEEERCLCPYCEEELVIAGAPFCKECAVVFRSCIKCQVTVLEKDAKSCPKCGGPLD